MTPVDPNAPDVEVVIPDDAPAWAREPAKLVGWIIAAVILLAGLVVSIGGAVTDLLPERARAYVVYAVGIATAVGIGATRIQAILTRNGIGKAGNGKDGVISPAYNAAELKATAAAVAQAKAVDPATGAQ